VQDFWDFICVLLLLDENEINEKMSQCQDVYLTFL